MYLKEPEKYLVHVDGKLLAQAVEWLFNEADFNFKELDLSGQEGIFKLSTSELPGNALHGKNLRNVTLLNVSNCHLDDSILSELKHLPDLQTLLISDNDLTDVSTLEHPKLTNIDVTGNPVPVIDIDFEQCPGLVKINVGSLATRALSLKVMKRICLGRLLVDVAESYKTNMIIPPPYIVKNNFNKKQVEEYLNSGVFDVSWFMSESFMQEEDLVSAILDILSMDKRNIRVFKMCNQPDCASKIGPRIDELFTCTALDDIEQLDLSENNMTHTPLCPSLTKLHTVNLLGNNLGSGTGKFQDGINVLGAVTHLNISHCHLDQVPDVSQLVSLEFLDISHNAISSLHCLESMSLKRLVGNGNVFPVLDVDPTKVPLLADFSFGSEKCMFVDFHVLEKTSITDLKLQCSEEGKKCLMIPPPSLLNNRSELATYIKNTELSLDHFHTSDPKLQCECVLWAVQNKPIEVHGLNLSNQVGFCRFLGIPGLQKVLSKMTPITNLDLSACKLKSIPCIESLTKLKALQLADNDISEFEDL